MKAASGRRSPNGSDSLHQSDFSGLALQEFPHCLVFVGCVIGCEATIWTFKKWNRQIQDRQPQRG